MIDAVSSLASFTVDGAAGTARVEGTRPAGIGSTAATGAPDFGAVLAEVTAGGVQTMRAGETAAIAGLKGKASVQEVVQAVMSAEQSLQAALAVRDKVVAAYQEISRMAI